MKNGEMSPVCSACRANGICNELDKGKKVTCANDIYDKWNTIALNPCPSCVYKDTGILEEPCYSCLGEPMYDKFELSKEQK